MNLQDFKSQIEKSTNVLLVLPYLADSDAVATSAILYNLLSKKDKKVTIASSTKLSEKYSSILKLIDFDLSKVINSIKPVSYVISVADMNQQKVDVTWERIENKINLSLTPEGGEVDFEKISFSKEGGIYDLVIVINVSKLEDLGSVYTNHSKYYENFNIISVGSELKIGETNAISLVEPNYSTTSEVLFKNIEELDGELNALNAEITAHGIVGSTNGLQRVRNTRTYGVISEIANKFEVDVPAIVRKYFYSMNQQDVIIRERILKNLKFDDSRKAVYSVLTKNDLSQTNLNNFDFNTILPYNVNGKYDYAFLVYEVGITSNVLIYSTKAETKLSEIIARGKGVLGREFGLITINSNANDAATRALNVISGGSLEDKVIVKPQPVIEPEKKVEKPVQSTQADEPKVEEKKAETNDHLTPTASPFTKANEYVVDTAAEPMKKANYFSSQDKPFDSHK